MRLICAPEDYPFPTAGDTLPVVLYGHANRTERGSAGAAVKHHILHEKLVVDSRAWDFLSLALSVVTADLAGHREHSPDGWTREFELELAVSDPGFWNTQQDGVERALAFLTTDRWRVRFVEGGIQPTAPQNSVQPTEDCIVLLSGGLDSLVGAIDLAASGKKPFAVSQLVRGDAENQEMFARRISGGLRHLQLNHNAQVPDPEEPPTQRARSLIFLAYGVLAATTLARYQAGQMVTVYICENGFIAINPPLTGARLGSLSTRTTHPVFLNGVQGLLNAAGLRVRLENPYQFKTKGEMLSDCTDQTLIKSLAVSSTSCGRFKRYGYKHCGRCMPCQIRRAAFLAWGVADETTYVFEDIGKDDEEHARFDDIRSAAMAIAEVQAEGLEDWLGNTLSTTLLGDVSGLKAVVGRGLDEVAALHSTYGVK